MKYAIILAAVLLTSTVSQAKTLCNLNTGKDDIYDKILFTGEVDTNKLLIIRKGSDRVEEFNYEQLTTVQQWKAVDGSTMVVFSRDGGDYAIGIGRVDMSKGKTNALPIEAIVSGAISEKRPLSLTMPAKRLSAVCFELKF
jgi:hypothetical protein